MVSRLLLGLALYEGQETNLFRASISSTGLEFILQQPNCGVLTDLPWYSLVSEVVIGA
jgi:hypothetical protein